MILISYVRLMWKLDTDLCPRNGCNGVRSVIHGTPRCVKDFFAHFSEIQGPNGQQIRLYLALIEPFWESKDFRSRGPIEFFCVLLRWLISLGNLQWFLGPFHSSMPSDRVDTSNSLHFQGAVPPSQALPVESRETCWGKNCRWHVVDLRTAYIRKKLHGWKTKIQVSARWSSGTGFKQLPCLVLFD